jgi:hypothetical protein
VCAFGVMAAPALAAEFAASREPTPISGASPGTTKGLGIGGERNQELKFNDFTIKCEAKTRALTPEEGAFTEELSPTFTTEIKFTKCLTIAKFGSFVGGIRTSFNGGNYMKIIYHTNGWAELSGAAASFKISGKICTISWPAQTVPLAAEKKPEEPYSAAVYSNTEVPVVTSKKFPTGFQKRMIIANEFLQMKWEDEEGQCTGEGGFEEEAKKTEGHNAKWIGTLEEEVTGGNLSYIP